MNRHLDAVEVLADLEWLEAPQQMGWLRYQGGGRGAVFSFEYDPEWLTAADVFAFDPDLALATGPQYPPVDRANFGVFLDSAPDRWGRVLMQRREGTRARAERRTPRTLTEWDFLLGVHDATRMGALRFRRAGGAFLDDDAALAAPPLTSLRELQAASLRFETQPADADTSNDLRWLAQLVAPGSSLGGARPKASVRDEHGRLCIAKFPSRQDVRDVGAWELVAHRLATKAGINVPATRALHLSDAQGTTFLAERFDRTSNGKRRAFVSAMTLTQRRDGEPGGSYLELVDLLQSRGADTRADCTELFRRVVFNILIHNTDDHLRNHGFIVTPEGLRLSPAYDLNPVPDRTELTLAINETDIHCEVAIALDAAADYGLTSGDAARIVQQVRNATTGWRREAAALKIPRHEQDMMAAAFAK
ncbi:MAG: type II toxin-antitoxin system HipA family toxin [Rhodanobacteraceae bacterium]|nr:MAG: type II toxin-antitoxin system HipA family toxin [Rhodanobacteraceae bacterium]